MSLERKCQMEGTKKLLIQLSSLKTQIICLTPYKKLEAETVTATLVLQIELVTVNSLKKISRLGHVYIHNDNYLLRIIMALSSKSKRPYPV